MTTFADYHAPQQEKASLIGDCQSSNGVQYRREQQKPKARSSLLQCIGLVALVAIAVSLVALCASVGSLEPQTVVGPPGAPGAPGASGPRGPPGAPGSIIGADDDDDSSSSSSSSTSDNDDDFQRRKRQHARCHQLHRAWPAAEGCPPREMLVGIVEGLAFGNVSRTGPLIDSIGFTYSYYSPVCGLFEYVHGLRDQRTREPMTKRTATPIASLSKHMQTMTVWKLARRDGPLSMFDTLDKYIATDELFDTDKVVVGNVAVTPRAHYDNVLNRDFETGGCLPATGGSSNPAINAVFPPVFYFPNGTRSSYTPVSNGGERWIEFWNGASPARDQCLDQINPHTGIETVVAERATGRRFDELIDEYYLDDPAMCSMRNTACPSTGVAPEALPAELRDDFTVVYNGFNQAQPDAPLLGLARSGEFGQYLGGHCFSTATDILKSLHGVLDNEFLLEHERTEFEQSFERCDRVFKPADGGTFGTTCTAFSAFDGSPANFWGATGLVRTVPTRTLIPLQNPQTTFFAGAFGAAMVRQDATGQYSVLVPNGLSARAYQLGVFLQLIIPTVDPASFDEKFIVDMTSTLDPPSLGNNVGASAAAASSASASASTLLSLAQRGSLSDLMHSHEMTSLVDRVAEHVESDAFRSAAEALQSN